MRCSGFSVTFLQSSQLWDKPLYSLKGQIPQPIPNLINVFDEKIVDKIKILFSCKNHVESRFLALCKSKKTLRICISTNLQGQFLCLGNYSVGWAFCPLTGYFTLPVDKHVMGQNHLSSQGANPTTSKVMHLVIFFMETSVKMPPFNVQFSW